MKKILCISLISVLAIVCLFVLTGCANNEGTEGTSNNTSTPENYTSVSLLDKINGYEVTVNYPNDGSIELKNQTDTYVDLVKADENLSMHINKNLVYQNSYDSYKKDYSSKDGYKEVTFGSYSGYAYVDSYNAVNVNLILGDAGEQKMSVVLKVTNTNSSEEKDMVQVIEGDFIKDIAEHLVYNSQAEKYEVDGTISSDGKFYVKPIDENLLENYLVAVESSSSGVDVDVKDGDKNAANISISSNSYKTLEECVSHQSSDRVYTDITIGEYSAKVWNNSEKYASQNKTFYTYFVEKDSNIYMIVVQTFNSFSSEMTNKVLEETVNNIAINENV